MMVRRARRVIVLSGFMVAAVGALGCPTDSGDPGVTHVGLTTAGDTVALTLLDDGSYSVVNRGAGTEAAGTWETSSGGTMDGFVQFDGDSNQSAALLPDRLLTGVLPTGTGRSELTWAVSTTADVDLLDQLQQGNWTWMRLREDGQPLEDYGFLSFVSDRFYMSVRSSSEGGPDFLPWGENQVEEEEADVAGTWAFGEGDHPQSLVLHGADGDWSGYGWPGWGLVLRPPDERGIIVAFWAPYGHNQLSLYDGVHRLIAQRLDATGSFGDPRPHTLDIFGTEAVMARFAVDGQLEEQIDLSTRSQVSNIGNLVWWTVSETERLIVGQVGDFSFFWTAETVNTGPPPGVARGGGGDDDDDSGNPGTPQAPSGTDMLSFGVGAHYR